MAHTSHNRSALTVITLAKRLFATGVSLAVLLSMVVLIVVTTLRIAAIDSLAPRILAAGADIVFGTILLLGGIYATVRLFVLLLGDTNIP